jgi:hypothetical protein
MARSECDVRLLTAASHHAGKYCNAQLYCCDAAFEACWGLPGAAQRTQLEAEIMKKHKDITWKTKYGVRRLRNEAPTLAEAIAAAQGLSANPDTQVEIAASLMGLPREQVRAELIRLGPPKAETPTSVTFAGPASAPRAVTVERKPSRRAATAVARPGRAVWNSTARNWR